MDEQIVKFRITNLLAHVSESIALEWQGREFDSGPLIIELDENAATGNQGRSIISVVAHAPNSKSTLSFPNLLPL